MLLSHAEVRRRGATRHSQFSIRYLAQGTQRAQRLLTPNVIVWRQRRCAISYRAPPPVVCLSYGKPREILRYTDAACCVSPVAIATGMVTLEV